MKSKTLNKLLKTVFLLSPLLISTGAVNGAVEDVFKAAQGIVDKVGSGSQIGPIQQDDVQLIYSSTWDDPSTWHDPGPDTFSTTARDRFL